MVLLASAAGAVPVLSHWVMANGARVYFVPAPSVPMMDVRVVFDAGGARDGGKPGLARLTSILLGDGAGELDADGIAQRFESLGAQFDTQSLRDMGIVSLRSLTDPVLLQPALESLASVLAQPRFDPADLARERDRMLVALRAEEQSPSSIASKRFYAELYGSHPYGQPPQGTAASLAAITRDDVLAFYRRYYVGRNAVVTIVGALSRAQAAATAEQVVGALPAGAPAPALPPVAPLAEAKEVTVRYPSAQTHVLVGQPAMMRDDPDYFPLCVGNHILGGNGLVARLSRQVRERRGLAYSVDSYFSPMHRAGPWIMGLQTRNAQADKAIAVLRATFERFLRDGPTEEELKEAKSNLIGGFPLQIESNADIVDYLGAIGFYELPLNYLATYTARIAAVTREQVMNAMRRRLHPERMVTVVVGKLHLQGGASR